MCVGVSGRKELGHYELNSLNQKSIIHLNKIANMNNVNTYMLMCDTTHIHIQTTSSVPVIGDVVHIGGLSDECIIGVNLGVDCFSDNYKNTKWLVTKRQFDTSINEWDLMADKIYNMRVNRTGNAYSRLTNINQAVKALSKTRSGTAAPIDPFGPVRLIVSKPIIGIFSGFCLKWEKQSLKSEYSTMGVKFSHRIFSSQRCKCKTINSLF